MTAYQQTVILGALVVLVVILQTAFGVVQEIKGPQQTGILHRQVTIPCGNYSTKSMVSSFRWEDYIYNEGRDPIVIYKDGQVQLGHQNSHNYKVTADRALTIQALGEGDAGEYRCVVTSSTGEEYLWTYELALIGLPECTGDNYLMEDDREHFMCKAKYRGTLPTLRWSVGDKPLPATDNTGIGSAQMDLELVAKPEHDGKNLTCQLKTEAKMEKCDMVLHVTYKVRDAMISPSTAEVRVGQNITCSAHGNPTPKVVLNIQGEKPMQKMGERSVSVMVTEEWRSMKQVQVGCQASNIIGTEETRVEASQVTYTILVPTTTSTTTTTTTTRPSTSTTTTVRAVKVADEVAEAQPTPSPAPSGHTAKAGANIVGIAAGVIIAILVIVIIIIAIVCISRRTKTPKGSKHGASKDDEAAVHFKDGQA